jgi:hypothetical protein
MMMASIKAAQAAIPKIKHQANRQMKTIYNFA